MKFITEGIKNGAISVQQLFEMVFGGCHQKRFFGDTDFRLKNFLVFSTKARKELITLILKTHNEELLADFFKRVISLAAYGAPKNIVYHLEENLSEIKMGTCLRPNYTKLFGENPRLVLVKEFLLWYSWGVTIRELPEACFSLIYYGRVSRKTDKITYSRFWEFPEEIRKKVIKIDFSINRGFNNASSYDLGKRNITEKDVDRYTIQWGDNPAFIMAMEFLRWMHWAPNWAPTSVSTSFAVVFTTFLKQTPLEQACQKIETTEFTLKPSEIKTIKIFLKEPKYSGNDAAAAQEKIISLLNKHLQKK